MPVFLNNQNATQLLSVMVVIVFSAQRSMTNDTTMTKAVNHQLAKCRCNYNVNPNYENMFLNPKFHTSSHRLCLLQPELDCNFRGRADVT